MITYYPAKINSPQTEIVSAIDAASVTITVADISVFPTAPNLATLGVDSSAETILYTGIAGDDLTGITRGFQGTASSWAIGIKIARYFTAYDHDTVNQNVATLSASVTSLSANMTLLSASITILNNKSMWGGI